MLVGSYNRKCKDSQGGVSEVWLMKWQKYSRSQIVINDNILVSFPVSQLYKYESLTTPKADETMQEDEGGKFYNQSISVSIRADVFEDITKIEWRVVFKDKNGLYRIFGLYNGMECGSIEYKTGGAKTELNGYTFNFVGKEEKQSFFIDELSLFDETFFILTEDGNILTTESGEKLKWQ